MVAMTQTRQNQAHRSRRSPLTRWFVLANAMALTAVLGSCSGPLLQAEPKNPSSPAPSPQSERPFPNRQTQAPACIRDSEACNPNGVACCAGFICVGTRGAFCVSQH